jgi:hypothetical protein
LEETVPTTQALQVFYGTIPLILVLAGIFFREQLLLQDILKRLAAVEEKLGRVIERLTTLESRAGLIYHD